MTRHVLTALVVLGTAPAAQAQGKFDDLLLFLPPQANAVVVADVQALYNSPLGTRGKWATQAPLGLPPQLRETALATHLDLDDLRGGHWEVGAARLAVRLTADDIARREKGAVDTVARSQVVLSPRDAFFVDLRPWVVGVMAPANRQELARWIDFARNNRRIALSPFLQESVAGLDRATQFVLAVDLADAVHPEALRRRLAESPAVVRPGTDLGQLTRLLAGVRGVKLVVRVDDKIHGELTAEFSEPAAPLAGVLRPLLTQFLADRGASVEALEDWTGEAKGNALVLRGELPEKGLRRVVSLVLPPPPPAAPGEEGEKASPLTDEIRTLGTQRYFRAVTSILDDLKRPSRRTQQDYARFATWHESFAQRIEQLPTFNVDEELVKYGLGVAQRLRAIAYSLRGEKVDVQKLEQSIGVTSMSIYSGVNGWGRAVPGVFLNTNMAEVQARQSQLIEQGHQDRQDLWANVEKATDAIRRQMYEKYRVEF